MKRNYIIPMLMILLCVTNVIHGGPAAYGICQTGCNTVTTACYKAAGGIFGVVMIPACSIAQGTCMAACVTAGLAPTA